MTQTNEDEMLLVRLRGGPLDGITGGARRSVIGWPMPEELPRADGVYRKVSESQLPDEAVNASILRGAEYEWVAQPPA